MSGTGAAGEPADALLLAARTAPERTLLRCRRAIVDAREESTLVLLRHAMALAHAERREQPAALAQLRRGLSVAERAGFAAESGSLRMTMAWLLLEGSDPAGCLAQLDRALPVLDRAERARARCLRGTALHVRGDHAVAERELTTAVRELDMIDDHHWLANALNARATARGYLGASTAGDEDLVLAQELFDRLRERARAACCRHNRGFLALRAGDLPRALTLFAEAERVGADLDVFPELLVDRSQALLAAGLVPDARADAERAVGMLAVTGRATKLAEAELAVADCTMLAGDPGAAEKAAGKAERLLRGQGRPSWAAAARARTLLARLAVPRSAVARPQQRTVTEAACVARDCHANGMRVLAARLRLAAARAADPDGARTLLAGVMAERNADHTELAVLGWLARARLAGTSRAAAVASLAGLRRADGSAASQFGEARGELAGLGLAAALVRGEPRSVVAWMDRRQSAATGGRGATAGSGVDREALSRALGDTALVSIACSAGRVVAVSVVDGRLRGHDLCRQGDAVTACRALRLAARPGAGSDTITVSAAELDALLLRPVLRAVGERPLVIVPPPEIADVPYAALPSCRSRPVSVAPSVSGWLAASGWLEATRHGDARRSGALWVAGNGLAHAAAEVRTLGARGGTVLAGEEATVPGVLAAMDGVDVVHLAAHGRFRRDAPSLSYLLLTDGPLYGYALAGIRRPPKLLVLSACEAGRTAASPSGRLTGLTTELLRRGTAAVIASVLPVRDADSAELMRALHDGLDGGLRPAAALAAAQAEHGDRGFVCLGAG